MSGSIVEQLGSWLAENRKEIAGLGIQVIDRTAEPSSIVPWKGTIGLIKDDIFVSYTVWERTELQTELIIVDGRSGKTLRSEDRNPKRAEEIRPVLRTILGDLDTGKYRNS